MKSILLTCIVSIFINVGFGQSLSDFIRAQEYIEIAKYDKAIELFNKLEDAKFSILKYDIFYGRAFCYYNKKEYQFALSDINKALKVNRKNKNYTWIKGNGYWLKSSIISHESNSIKSLNLLKKSSKYNETSVLFSTIAYEEIELERYEDAIKSSNYSLNLDPSNAWAYSNRALAKLYLKQYEAALKDVEKSIEIDDKNPFAFKHRALIYLALGDYESACLDLEHAATLSTTKGMSDYKMQEIQDLLKKHCH